jgi:hypothetical protein
VSATSGVKCQRRVIKNKNIKPTVVKSCWSQLFDTRCSTSSQKLSRFSPSSQKLFAPLFVMFRLFDTPLFAMFPKAVHHL